MGYHNTCMETLADTWNIHNRINLYLLNALNEEQLALKTNGKGRTIGEQFAHLHQVRLMWLKVAAPEWLTRLSKIEKADINKEVIKLGLEQSGEAMSDLFIQSAASGKIKGFKPHATAFLGYLIAHESHHRGQITLSLKLAGHAVDAKIAYGLWEWGSR